jgi:excisionase family DNA binding protein
MGDTSDNIDGTLRWLTVDQAARRASVSPSTIWRLAREKKLNPRKIRNCTRFDAYEIDRLFE